MPSSERSLPTWWINVWIVLGCFAFVLFFGVPLLMSRNLALEYDRYQACVERRRADCQPSLIWLLSDWKLSTSTAILGTDIGSSMLGATSTPPTFTSIELVGLPKEGENYLVNQVGQSITLRIQARNTQRVELFVSNPLSSVAEVASPTRPAVVLTPRQDGTFEGTWSYPTDFNGLAVLNFHAYASDKGSTEQNSAYTSQSLSVAIKK